MALLALTKRPIRYVRMVGFVKLGTSVFTAGTTGVVVDVGSGVVVMGAATSDITGVGSGLVTSGIGSVGVFGIISVVF